MTFGSTTTGTTRPRRHRTLRAHTAQATSRTDMATATRGSSVALGRPSMATASHRLANRPSLLAVCRQELRKCVRGRGDAAPIHVRGGDGDCACFGIGSCVIDHALSAPLVATITTMPNALCRGRQLPGVSPQPVTDPRSSQRHQSRANGTEGVTKWHRGPLLPSHHSLATVTRGHVRQPIGCAAAATARRGGRGGWHLVLDRGIAPGGKGGYIFF